MDKNTIAIGWKEMGDLSNLPVEREAFRKKIYGYILGRKKGKC